MKVLRIGVEQSGNFSVLLSDVDERIILPIAIGPFEAQAILLPLQEETPPRPLTHDLMKSMYETLGASVEKVEITSIKEGVYYAEIYMRQNGKSIVIDARPSDAIALVVRCGCPLYMAPRLVEFTYNFEDVIFTDEGSEGR